MTDKNIHQQKKIYQLNWKIMKHIQPPKTQKTKKLDCLCAVEAHTPWSASRHGTTHAADPLTLWSASDAVEPGTPSRGAPHALEVLYT